MKMTDLEKLEAYIPIDLFTLKGFLLAFLVLSFFILIRYFLIVGVFHFVLYKLKNNCEKLHDLSISHDQYKHEIKWSVISTIIFAVSGYAMGLLWQLGYTQIYLDLDSYGLIYLPLSFLIYTLIHEFYFYFTHVAMHHPLLYKKVHHVHHVSHKVSPWASFSFHPWECLVHALFFPVMVLVIPIHPLTIIIYFTFMTLTAVSNHSGVEIIKSNVIKDIFVSGSHHYQHHKYYRGNYSLFYTFIDRLFGTEIVSEQVNDKKRQHTGELV